MIITTEAIRADDTIHEYYTGDGENVSPPLTFSQVPSASKSLAFILDDPDAPNGTFTHWVLYDISPATLQVPEDGTPFSGKVGKNSAGAIGYTGPKPPEGTHRYFFTLYALDIETLGLEEGATKQEVLDAIEGHILATAEVTSTYSKQ